MEGEAAGISPSQQRPLLHVLALPHPLQGHITPLLHFCLELGASYSVAVTFVLTDHILSRMGSRLFSPHIKFMGVADNLPSDHPRQSSFSDSYDAVMGMEASVHMLLRDLSLQNQLPNIIICDTFVAWGHKAAVKFGVPSVAFVTTNVSAFCAMSSTEKLIDSGILPLKTVDGSSKYVDQLISLPGLPPLQPHEIPYSMRMPSSHYRFKFLVEQFSEATKAIAVLVNSISELERNVLQNLEYKVPVFCIGPSLMLGDARTLSSMNGLTTSILPVQEDCLSWLDKQITGSVLYVSFGSITTFTKLQLMELALGLEASEQVFLWVIRPGSFEGLLSDVLPPGFVERTKNKCYIVSWCPQVQVLSHKAVGGFLTHCGWNSILENISLGGLPMICWPDGGEQALNAKVVVDVWKVGLSVAKQDDITVGREEIEHLVRALMQGEGAQQFKCKAAKLRGIVHQAVQETGSSVGNIKKVLEIVRNVRSKSC